MKKIYFDFLFPISKELSRCLSLIVTSMLQIHDARNVSALSFFLIIIFKTLNDLIFESRFGYQVSKIIEIFFKHFLKKMHLLVVFFLSHFDCIRFTKLWRIPKFFEVLIRKNKFSLFQKVNSFILVIQFSHFSIIKLLFKYVISNLI